MTQLCFIFLNDRLKCRKPSSRPCRSDRATAARNVGEAVKTPPGHALGAQQHICPSGIQVTNVEGLKQEIHFLNKTLLREDAAAVTHARHRSAVTHASTRTSELDRQETKAKALQEELENPMNVHRWRELEAWLDQNALRRQELQ